MSIELVLGLGNPGPRYAETRHNVGFRVVDELARRSGAGVWDRHPSCEIRPLAIVGGVIGAKPLTYMNRSGDAVQWLIERYALEPEQILVVVDDIDLPIGRLRLRKHGGRGRTTVCETSAMWPEMGFQGSGSGFAAKRSWMTWRLM